MARGGYGNPALQARAEAQARANGESIGTHLERALLVLWRQWSFPVPLPQREYKFALPRQYRFDFAWPSVRVAIEMEGGIWMQLSGGKSRHTFPPGFIEDLRKYDLAASMDWLVFRFTRGMLDEPGQLQAVNQTVLRRLDQMGKTLSDLPSEQQLSL